MLKDYRHYLLGEFEIRKVRNPNYSLRAFARDLEASPSRLSEALNGKRGISLKMADQLIRKLSLSDVDSRIFRLSVEADHSRSKIQKAQAREKLNNLLTEEESLPLKTFTIVDWVAEAVLKMSEREVVTKNPLRVAEKLSVPEFMVTNALRFLVRLGLIESTGNFKTYLENRGRGRKLNVDYVQILEQAQKAYHSSQNSEGFQHQVFLLEDDDIIKAQGLLRRCFAEIKKLEKKTKGARIIFISNQVFSVERGK